MNVPKSVGKFQCHLIRLWKNLKRKALNVMLQMPEQASEFRRGYVNVRTLTSFVRNSTVTTGITSLLPRSHNHVDFKYWPSSEDCGELETQRRRKIDPSIVLHTSRSRTSASYRVRHIPANYLTLNAGTIVLPQSTQSSLQPFSMYRPSLIDLCSKNMQ